MMPDVEKCEKKLDVQLKVRGECPEIGPVGKMNKECEIRGALENDQWGRLCRQVGNFG